MAAGAITAVFAARANAILSPCERSVGSCRGVYPALKTASKSSTGVGWILNSARERFPIGCWAKPLHDVDLMSIEADENAGLAALDASKYACRCILGQGFCELRQPRNTFVFSRFRRVRPQPPPLRNRRANSSRIHAGNKDGTAFQFVPESLGKSPHCKFARGVSRLSRRRNNSEYTRKIHNVRARLLPQNRQKIFHAINGSPEIDCHQPAKIIQRNLFKRAVQRHSRVVDQQRHAAVPVLNIFRESADAGLVRNIQDMRRDCCSFSREHTSSLDQGLLVNVRQCQSASSGG